MDPLAISAAAAVPLAATLRPAASNNKMMRIAPSSFPEAPRLGARRLLPQPAASRIAPPHVLQP
jgi:hypothetical protein